MINENIKLNFIKKKITKVIKKSKFKKLTRSLLMHSNSLKLKIHTKSTLKNKLILLPSQTKFNFQPHLASLYSVLQSHDQQFIFTGSQDNTLKIFEFKNFKLLKSVKIHRQAINCMVLSFQGQLFTGSSDKTIKQWNIPMLNTTKIFVGHQGQVKCLKLSNDQKKLYSGSSDRTIRVWNIIKGCQQNVYVRSHPIQSLLLFNNFLYSGSNDGSLVKWQENQFELTKLNSIKGHESRIVSIEKKQNENKIYTGSHDKYIKIWSQALQLQRQFEMGQRVGSLCLIGQIIFWCNDKLTIIIANSKQLTNIYDKIESDKQGYITSMNLNYKKSKLYITYYNGACKIFTIKSKQLINQFRPSNQVTQITAMITNFNDLWIATNENVIRKYDMSNSKEKLIYQTEMQKERIIVLLYVYEDENEWIISGNIMGEVFMLSMDGKLVKYFNLNTQILLMQNVKNYLYICSQDEIFQINLKNFETIGKILESNIQTFTVSNHFIIIATKLNTIIVYFRQNKSAQNIIYFKQSNVQKLYICFDQVSLFLANNIGFIKIINIKEGKEIFKFKGHTDSILDMIVQEKQKLLFSSSSDKTIKLWSLHSYSLINTLQYTQFQVTKIRRFDNYLYGISGGQVYKWRIFDGIQNFSYLLCRFLMKMLDSSDFNHQAIKIIWKINSNSVMMTQLYYAIICMNQQFFKQILEQYKYGLIQLEQSSFGNFFNKYQDPIILCLKNNYFKQLHLLIQYLNKEKVAPLKLETLNQILSSPNQQVVRLLWKIFRPYSFPQLNIPHYGIIKKDKMLTVNSKFGKIDLDYLRIYQEQISLKCQDLDQLEDQDNFVQQIKFYASWFPIKIEKGSQQSIRFLQQFLETPHKELYFSPLIKIIDMKWNQAKQYLIFQALFHFFILILSMLSLAVFRNILLLIVFVSICNSLLFIFQLLIAYSAGLKNHLLNYFNYLDFFLPISIICTLIIQIAQFQQISIWLQFILLIIISIRIISILIIIDQFRYFIEMMKVVLRDIIPFSVILISTILCFSLIDFRVSNEGAFQDYLQLNWNIIFGQFDTSEYSIFNWIIYILKQSILTIAFLNILIAIVSDSYQYAKKNRFIIDIKERIGLILEYQYIFKLFKNKLVESQPEYLVGFVEVENFQHQQQIEKKIKKKLQQTFEKFSKIEAKRQSYHTNQLQNELKIQQQLLLQIKQKLKFKKPK